MNEKIMKVGKEKVHTINDELSTDILNQWSLKFLIYILVRIFKLFAHYTYHNFE